MESLYLILLVMIVVFVGLYKKSLYKYNKVIINSIRDTVGLLQKYKILLFFALIPPVLEIIFVFGRNVLKYLYLQEEFDIISNYPNSDFTPKPFDSDSVLNSLSITYDNIINPFHFSLPSMTFCIMVIILIPFYSIIIRKINSFVITPTEEYSNGLTTFYKIHRYTFFALLFVYFLTTIAVIFSENKFSIAIYALLIISIVTIPLAIAFTSILHQYLLGLITKTNRSKNKLFLQIFEDHRKMIECVIVISIILGLPSIIKIMATFSNILTLTPMSLILTKISNYSMYAIRLVSIFIFLTPYLVIKNRISFKESLKVNIQVIKSHYIIYLYFTGIGLAFISIPQVAYDYLYQSYRFGYFTIPLNIGFVLVRNLLIIIFYISFIKIIENRRSSNLRDSNSSA